MSAIQAMKETGAKLFATVTFLKGSWRILTNSPTPVEQAGLVEFRERNMPARLGVKRSTKTTRTKNEYLIEINTGDWVYPVLEKLNQKGIKFRLGSIPVKELSKDIKNGWCSDVPTLVGKSTFAWANASYAFFLVLEDASDALFTLSELGFFAYNEKKLTKRLQEVTRIVQMHASNEYGTVSLREYTNEDLGLIDGDEILVDGMVCISKSFALKMCYTMPDGHEKRKKVAKIHREKMGRLIFRLTLPHGLVKGLAVICPDDQLEADIVYHESALKPEFGLTEMEWSATAFEHPHIHTAMWDMQSMFNNYTWLLTEERFKQDAESLLQEFRDKIASGEIPDWIVYQETESHDDDGVPSMDHATSGWKKSYQRWQAAGMDLDSSSNLIFMAYSSLMNQMNKAVEGNKWWIPMSNAFTATVNTWEALRYMAGFDVPKEKRNIVFYDERFGVVIPGHRFRDTKDLHDTWDQDGDQAKFIRIKLWSSSPVLGLDGKNHQELRDTFVIPADMEVPYTPEDAVDACVIIRSPNGPGGYSIHEFDAETMPWLRVCEERIPVIDLANAPLGMKHLLANVEIGTEIPTSVNYGDGELSRDRAVDMIQAQMSNPNVGRYANLIMVQSALFGPSYPSKMPAIGNDIIDTVQQTADTQSFEYVRSGLIDMQDQLIQRIISEKIPVDQFVFKTRLIGLSEEEQELVEPFLVEGKFTRMNNLFLKTYKTVAETTKVVSFERRLAGNIRNFVFDSIPHLSPNSIAWAAKTWNKYNNLLEQADAVYESSIKNSESRVYKAFAEAKRTETIHKVVKELYDTVMQTKYPSMYAVVLYRWIIDPMMTRTTYGRSDRIIFQNSDEGQETVMDLLIQGIQDMKKPE